MISQEEYELLKKCDDKFKWVARDKNTELWVYTKKPYKGMYRWDSVGNINLLPRRSKYLFQFIQWDDEEPYRISDLVKEYEDGGDIGYTLEEYAKYIIKFSEKLLTELENEEMKKDKEWAKKEIKELITEESQNYPHDEMVEKEIVLGILNQLDEPEVLLWDLPVIPNFVAEYIQEGKELGYDLGTAMTVKTEKLKCIRDYIKNNEETFARAWLDGYTVEEPRYYALVKGYELIKDDHFWTAKNWKLDTINGNVFVSNRDTVRDRYLIKMSKEDWNRLGINDSNAHFVKVDEVEDER